MLNVFNHVWLYNLRQKTKNLQAYFVVRFSQYFHSGSAFEMLILELYIEIFNTGIRLSGFRAFLSNLHLPINPHCILYR